MVLPDLRQQFGVGLVRAKRIATDGVIDKE
jgi:hypothetical protein